MSDKYYNEDDTYYDECPDEEPSDAEIAELAGEPIRKIKKKSTADNKKSRAEKKCKIPVDYDPSPSINQLPEGHVRPESRCYVDSIIVQPFDIGEDVPLLSDHNVEKMSVKERKFRFLASKCVSVSGEFYVKERDSGIWKRHTKPDAISRLQHDWIDRTRFNITRQTVADFFIQKRHPVLHQTLYVPGCGDFVQFRGNKCLNTCQYPPKSFDPNCLETDEFELLLKVINENLLNLPTRSSNAIIEEILADKATLTKWVFHWFASLYQNPGKHIGTSIWFIGSQQGVGKGLLSSALMYLVDDSNARKVNTKELGGEWSDFIAGNQLLIGDEIEMASKKGFNDMLKSYVANDVIALRKRNVGEFNIPNVANWMFTTNKPKPITIDDDDRRNTFVATREDGAAKTLARQFGTLPAERKVIAYQGLGCLLNGIEVNHQLISHAIDTPLKDQLKSLSAKPVHTWFKESPFVQRWKLDTFHSANDLYSKFRGWVSDFSYHESVINNNAFNSQLAELTKKGFVSDRRRRRLEDGTRPWGYVKVKGYDFDDDPSFSDEVLVSDLDPDSNNARSEQVSARVLDIKRNLKKHLS